MGFESSKVRAVHNGLELSNWPAEPVDATGVRAEFDVASDAPLLVTASRLFHWKGQHLILQALPAVKRRFPDVKLLIVGNDDSRAHPGDWTYSAELRRLVEELDLERNVVFTGWRTDVVRLMSAADLYVMPSFEEPFGMVYIEAMALQRPVVALDNGGAKEIVDHGGSGLLSPPGDVDSLADNISQLIADPELRRLMGKRGRARVIERFTSANMTEAVAAIYEELVAPAT